jgi:hypothetical protein
MYLSSITVLNAFGGGLNSTVNYLINIYYK